VRQAAERGDVVRLQRAARRLAFVGQDEAAVHRTLGEIELRRGRVELALREFDKSLALKEHPKVYFQKGSLYAERREWGRAAESFEAAYAIDPVPVLLVSHLTRALVQSGRSERAEEVLREALVRHPGDPTLTTLLEQVGARGAGSDS
jgi:tetratricopeptide (TPR) repeat protein